MGDDLSVVNAARVSFSKSSVWGQKNPTGGSVLETKDAKLIKYLADHEHWTPFGHCQLTLHFKMPIFVARQFMRSNIGVVYNEVSRRYVDSPPEFYFPQVWRKRPTNGMKQGSSDEEFEYSGSEKDLYGVALQEYNWLLEGGVAPEMARMVLPLSTYTEFWATMSLAAAARIYKLRVDPHAQREVREYAHAMRKLIYPRFPISWDALTDEGEKTGN